MGNRFVFSAMLMLLTQVGSATAAMQATGEIADQTQSKEMSTSSSKWSRIDNPKLDGWNSEALAEAAQVRLDEIWKELCNSKNVSPEQIKNWMATKFKIDIAILESQPLVETDIFRVLRSKREAQSLEVFEVEEAANRLNDKLEKWLAGDFKKIKSKIVRVFEHDESSFETVQFVSFSGKLADGMYEQNESWSVRWKKENTELRISSLRVFDIEQSQTKISYPLFSDCTESVLQANDSWHQQLQFGFNHWLLRMEESRGAEFISYPGLAIGDVNGDGLEDLYLCQGMGLPNRLFVQKPDGTVIDVSKECGVDWLENSRSALLVDLDNDGDQDLAVAMISTVVIAENIGQGKFRIKSSIAVDDDTMSLTAADVNNDSQLDLFVCGYYETFNKNRISHFKSSGYSDFVYHDAKDGGENRLLINNGKLTFRDATSESGLNQGNSRYSFAASFNDFDLDGDFDLYIANDYGPDNLFRNQLKESGKLFFQDVSKEAGAERGANGMAVDWGDPNRDGLMDIHVANMWSSAGNRVTNSDRFKPESPMAKSRLQRFAKGNTLLKNKGDGTFADISSTAGIELGRWAWSSKFVDFNNDGWEDIVVTNGYVTTEDTSDL